MLNQQPSSFIFAPLDWDTRLYFHATPRPPCNMHACMHASILRYKSPRPARKRKKKGIIEEAEEREETLFLTSNLKGIRRSLSLTHTSILPVHFGCPRAIRCEIEIHYIYIYITSITLASFFFHPHSLFLCKLLLHRYSLQAVERERKKEEKLLTLARRRRRIKRPDIRASAPHGHAQVLG